MRLLCQPWKVYSVFTGKVGGQNRPGVTKPSRFSKVSDRGAPLSRFGEPVEGNNVDHPGNVIKSTIWVKHYCDPILQWMSPIRTIAYVGS